MEIKSVVQVTFKKLANTRMKMAKLYDVLMLFALVELCGCGRTFRKVMAIGDYGVEKFIRGKGGALAYVLFAVFGAILLFVTNRSRSNEEMVFRKRLGIVFIVIGVTIMFIRNYLAFYYVGRKTPY